MRGELMMTKIRGFEIISTYKHEGIELPSRSTKLSAGYDLQAAEDVTLPSFWQSLIQYQLKSLKQWIHGEENKLPSEEDVLSVLKPTLIPTGLKVYMPDDEYLQIISRSSNPIKRNIMLPNSVGIIDADYYNNPSNEGHIYVQMINYGLRPFHIHKGDRIAQGIFAKYLTIDNEIVSENERTGGFGSSDEA